MLFQKSLLVFACVQALAQDTLTYFNVRWERVYQQDEARFFRIGKNNFGFYDGPVRDFYLSGKLQMEGQYANDKAFGLFKFYHENGQLSYIQNLNKKRILSAWDSTGKKTVRLGNGHFEYYTGSSIAVKGKYRNGKPVGCWHYNNENGVRVKEIYYDQRGSIYNINCWDDNGDTLQVKNGTGTSISYFANGNLKHFIEMKDQKLHGVYRTYYENGLLRVSASYQDGNPDGEVNVYYDNGQLRHRYFVIEKQIHGETMSWHPNGNIRSHGFYSMGKFSGKWTRYDEHGNKIQVLHYNQMPRGQRRRPLKLVPLGPIPSYLLELVY